MWGSMTKLEKRTKVLGRWAAERGYDSWDIFIGERKWCGLMAVTKKPVSLMLRDNMTANINWATVRAKKLT